MPLPTKSLAIAAAIFWSFGSGSFFTLRPSALSFGAFFLRRASAWSSVSVRARKLGMLRSSFMVVLHLSRANFCVEKCQMKKPPRNFFRGGVCRPRKTTGPRPVVLRSCIESIVQVQRLRREGDAFAFLPLHVGVVAAVGDDDAGDDAHSGADARRVVLERLDRFFRQDEAAHVLATAVLEELANGKLPLLVHRRYSGAFSILITRYASPRPSNA